jgi:hypothetical protein
MACCLRQSKAFDRAHGRRELTAFFHDSFTDMSLEEQLVVHYGQEEGRWGCGSNGHGICDQDHEHEPAANLLDRHVGRPCLCHSLGKKNSLFADQALTCACVD